MLIDANRMAVNERIRPARSPSIERGRMTTVRGIIVHQTGAPTARSSLSSYQNASANGAHFLIEPNGTIYQTASIYKKTWHVGRLKARCLAENRCTPVETQALRRFNPAREHTQEMQKKVPDRYPSNEDSIGIELVGEALPRGANIPDSEKTYQPVTDVQNASLRWLVAELARTLGVPITETFRHPVVSRKNPTEASTAQWSTN